MQIKQVKVNELIPATYNPRTISDSAFAVLYWKVQLFIGDRKMFDIENRSKPVVQWTGGKSALLPQLISHFPNYFGRLIEPFVGGGAVFLALEPQVPFIISDINTHVITMYRQIREDPWYIIKELDRYEAAYNANPKEAYIELRSNDVFYSAARMIALSKTCFNGLYRLNKKGEFNVPWSQKTTCPVLYTEANLFSVACRLNRPLNLVLNGGYKQNICNAVEGDFVYCDPPYHPISKTSNFTAYTGSSFTAEDQIDLMEVCEEAIRRGVMVAVSNSSCDLIKEIYSRSGLWNINIIEAQRNGAAKASSRGKVEELIITSNNF